MSLRQLVFLIYISLNVKYQQSQRVICYSGSFRRYLISAVFSKMEFNNQKNSKSYVTQTQPCTHRECTHRNTEKLKQISTFSVLQRRKDIIKSIVTIQLFLDHSCFPYLLFCSLLRFQLFCAPCSHITKNCTTGNDNFPQEQFLYLKDKGNMRRMVVAVKVCPQDYKLHYAVMNFSINVI